MASSRLSFATGVFAPWWLGLALAVSIPADAGQDAAAGGSLSPLSSRAPRAPEVLVPPISAPSSEPLGRLGAEAQRLFRKASFVLGETEEFKRLAEEIEPRLVLKKGARGFPAIDRSLEGDPVVGLRPMFESRLRRPGALAELRWHDILFTHDESSPVGGFAELDEAAEEAEPAQAFEPWPEGENPTTLASSAETSPGLRGAAGVTMRPAALNERIVQGASPAVHRAVALASATPVRPDNLPVEVVALAALPPGFSTEADLEPPHRSRPAVATAHDANSLSRERRCLAEAVYFEARGESDEGQAAVAQVVLNRVASGLYPATICGVVYQNRHRLNGCQFSFACSGKSLRVTEAHAWRAAVRIAAEVTSGRIHVDEVGRSTHYHAAYVRPRWAARLEKMDVIGHHIFYKLRPGQL